MPIPAPPTPPASPPFRPVPPVVIGLLGGIAAGKSAVAEAFAARGLCRIDADAIAREVTADPGVVRAVAAALGAGLVAPDGRLDRAAVADRVFRDAAARKTLEGLTHPAIRQRILTALQTAIAAGTSVLLDVPLLLEGGLIAECDTAVFVAASRERRLARAATRGWADGELDRREAMQAPLADKEARADFRIDNDGTLTATASQVDAVLAELLRRGPKQRRQGS